MCLETLQNKCKKDNKEEEEERERERILPQNYKKAFLEFQLLKNYKNLIVSWVQLLKTLNYPYLAYINGDNICIVFIFRPMFWMIYLQFHILYA